MIKKTAGLIFIFLSFLPGQLISQVVVSPGNVLPLDSNLSITEGLKKRLLPFKFILIGEMHGSREPVSFFCQAVKTLSTYKKVLAGFEISENEIGKSELKNHFVNLKSSNFFKKDIDGRASSDWLQTIMELAATENVELFFFDFRPDQKAMERDSAMYLNLKKEFEKDTSAVVITISGNIHNQMEIYNNQKTLGYFIRKFLSSSVLSVNHIYESGTMFNSTGKGAELREITGHETVLKSISKSKNYFYLDLQNDFSHQWNSFLFTTKINASYPVKNE